jgi:hypothetical protein
MTYWPKTQILSANTGSVDAFARWRVSQPVTLFDSLNQYEKGSLWWSESTAGAGAINFTAAEASVNLAVSAGGDSAIRQTFEYFRYEPGKSQLIIMTGTFGPATANVTKRIGYFDTANGVFFEQTGAGMAVVVRSSTSGAPSDALRYPQASWNVDKLNGSGPSGVTLVPSNSNIFWFDIEWLGVGRVRFGIWGPDGFPIVCHEERNANVRSTVYMTNATLPMRYEISSTGGAGSMQQICSTVQSEGGTIITARPRYFGVGYTSAIGVTTRQAVLSVRPKLTFKGLTNRIKVVPANFSFLVTANDCLWELVYKPTFTGVPVWQDANTAESSVEYAAHSGVGTGAITGGIVVASGFAGSAQGAFAREVGSLIEFKYPITLDLNGANPIAFSLVCTSLNNTSNVRATINWAENH